MSSTLTVTSSAGFLLTVFDFLDAGQRVVELAADLLAAPCSGKVVLSDSRHNVQATEVLATGFAFTMCQTAVPSIKNKTDF